MNKFDKIVNWVVATIVSILLTFMVVLVVWAYVTRDERISLPHSERSCERILLANPVPGNSDQVSVTEVKVCGNDLEFYNINPFSTGETV